MTEELFQINYGLIVLDPEQIDEDGDKLIVHFVGFMVPPTDADINSIKEEIKTDPEFGLMDIADRLEYELAPQELIDYFKVSIGTIPCDKGDSLIIN